MIGTAHLLFIDGSDDRFQKYPEDPLVGTLSAHIRSGCSFDEFTTYENQLNGCNLGSIGEIRSACKEYTKAISFARELYGTQELLGRMQRLQEMERQAAEDARAAKKAKKATKEKKSSGAELSYLVIDAVGTKIPGRLFRGSSISSFKRKAEEKERRLAAACRDAIDERARELLDETYSTAWSLGLTIKNTADAVPNGALAYLDSEAARIGAMQTFLEKIIDNKRRLEVERFRAQVPCSWPSCKESCAE